MTVEKDFICMDTIVMIRVVSGKPKQEQVQSILRAAGQFYRVEQSCSRFDSGSELMRLPDKTDVPIRVSPVLFSAIQFAVSAAAETGGKFDPSIGRSLEKRGFNRNYLTGERIHSDEVHPAQATYRDIVVNPVNRTITLRKPMVIDLGAVAKGMAIDLAAAELRNEGYEHFLVNAGGDIFAAGRNEQKEPWKIGIRHPVHHDEIAGTVRLENAAICTSGGYERPSSVLPGEHHLLDPLSGHSPSQLSSCSVIAPFAMLADAFSTAAIVLGPDEGIKKMEEMGLDCLMITRDMNVTSTKKFKEAGSWNPVL
ncbi:FAD:protein FMN transferase [Sporolactobacillus vineae]|uniref:FAD:protein FMN transferase n=1 Tax=Sporolactobacillus vineae TaxID=444463 RepID=UPI0002897716|nr:FAD:protein FMN transferase [Sporolactobacillus vineae]